MVDLMSLDPSSLLKNSRFGDDFVIQGFVVNLGGSDAGQV
jgi:hypothetical protein